MPFKYKLIESSCKEQELKHITVYGIQAECNEEVVVIEDISSIKDKVVRLIELIKEHSVSPSQLIYIVEDFII